MSGLPSIEEDRPAARTELEGQPLIRINLGAQTPTEW
jgi:hypothetical protein